MKDHMVIDLTDRELEQSDVEMEDVDLGNLSVISQHSDNTIDLSFAEDRLSRASSRTLSPEVQQFSDDEQDFDNNSARYENVVKQLRHHEKALQAFGDVEDPIIIGDQDEGENNTDSALFSTPLVYLGDDDSNDVEFIGSSQRRPSKSFTGLKELRSYKVTNGHFTGTCATDKFVELQDGTFMKIRRIFENPSGIVSITGEFFMRHNDFSDRSKWPKRTNEVVLISTIKEGYEINQVTRPIADVVKIRQLILTNQSFPSASIRYHPDAQPDMKYNKVHGALFCRWKQTHVLNAAGKIIEESIEKLSQEDADPAARAEHTEVRYQWRRRDTTPGGEHSFIRNSINGDSYTAEEARQYSFGDAFCGGGGVSCGADQAGLFIKFGVDINQNAMKTYKLNFANKGAVCFCQDIHDFIQETCKHIGLVDILHISPPCQPFSPAHTVANMIRDEMNEAAIFAVGELLKRLKPRAVTLEETYGLLNRHEEWCHALIKMFLDSGYSIRWTGARLEEYGLPQKRRRLLIIAAGPGEALPPFPAITHSNSDPNLRNLTTINEAIRDIPTGASVSHHNIEAATFSQKNRKPSYDSNTQAKTITTSGGIGNYHPSGWRGFTVREFSSLQRFPLNYLFADVRVTELRRQIGNAVPPYVIKKVYREIIKSLRKTDGLL